MLKTTIDGPSKAEVAEAEALEARGWSYHFGEERFLDRVRPGWRARLRERKETGAVFAPSRTPEEDAIERRLEEERAPARAQLVQDLAVAVESRAGVIARIFDSPVARATAANATARPASAPSAFFCEDPELTRARGIADRNEQIARENLTTYDMKTDARRRELQAVVARSKKVTGAP